MIVVTGGAGFIGSNIVHALNLRGESDILVVDNLGKGDKYKNLIGLKFREYMHMDDFMHEIENDDIFFAEDIDVIFHEGACSDTMEYDVNFMMKLITSTQKSCWTSALMRILHLFMRQVPQLTATVKKVFAKLKNVKML